MMTPKLSQLAQLIHLEWVSAEDMDNVLDRCVELMLHTADNTPRCNWYTCQNRATRQDPYGDWWCKYHGPVVLPPDTEREYFWEDDLYQLNQNEADDYMNEGV